MGKTKKKEIFGYWYEMISRNIKLKIKVQSSVNNIIFLKRGENIYMLISLFCMGYLWKFT